MNLLEIFNNPDYGFPGSISASPFFKKIISQLIENIVKLQGDVSNGTDSLTALTNFFTAQRDIFLNAVEKAKKIVANKSYKAPPTSSEIDARNQGNINYWTSQASNLEKVLEGLKTSPDDAVLEYLRDYWKSTIGLLRAARATCTCLIPCCKSSS